MPNTTATRCEVRIFTDARDYRGHVCRRPFKTDEQRDAGLCGIHLAGQKRREERSAAFRAQQAANDVKWNGAGARVDALRQHGIYATIDRTIMGDYTGGIRLTAENTDALIALLSTIGTGDYEPTTDDAGWTPEDIAAVAAHNAGVEFGRHVEGA